MKRIICLTTLMLLASVAAFADIARPDPTKTPKPAKGVNTSMTIRLDRNATEVKLIIPKSQIKQLRAELEQLDDDSDNTAAVTNPSSFSRTQTIVSGAFLSLALVFGGMWFVRSGKATTGAGKSLVILAVVAGIGSAATLVYANAGPPPITKITSKIFNKDQFRYRDVSGPVKIETTNEKTAELIVPDPQPTATPSADE
ncbi:MAG: hypothetical protein IPI64_13685 [Chloracidobacterium sp.]|nr:hypothetical protein [Chloracidobacterium sp.]